MKIIVDGMGGDYAPQAIVDGVVEASADLGPSDELVLVGREEDLRTALGKRTGRGAQIRIVNADSVITNEEAPVKAVRHKKDSSVVVGMNLLKQGEGDVFISAGSTGAVLAGSLLILGRIKGIDRPTLATIYPVIGHQPSLLADAGANAECRARNLLEFGIMGSIYMEKVLGRTDPTVGLINNGTEAEKGTSLTKEAHQLLSESGLNFIGNVETRELQNAVCDVVVTDGFTGNAVVKLTEGIGLMVLRELKTMFMKDARSKLSALLVGDKLKQLKVAFDYKEYGGAPILGVRQPVLKMHGSSDPMAVRQTILKAVPYVKEDVCGTIERSVQEFHARRKESEDGASARVSEGEAQTPAEGAVGEKAAE